MSAIGSKLRAMEGGLVAFWCPGCDGAHPLGVKEPAAVRWEWNGDGDKPTFSPSILVYGHKGSLTPGRDTPRCHSFVRNGMIEFLGDCEHALAGQSVPLPDFDA